MGRGFLPLPSITASAWMLSLALLAACASSVTGTPPSAGGPYTGKACSGDILLAAHSGVDACGQPRTLTWDFNNDGQFNDAVGETPLYSTFTLRPGVYTIRAQASSLSSPCGSPPIVVSTTVTLIAPAVPVIHDVFVRSQTDNDEVYVGEQFEVVAATEVMDCGRPYNKTIDCGPDNVATSTQNGVCQYSSCQYSNCQYSSPGEKHITVTLEQDGFVASAELVITVYTVSISGPYDLMACSSTTVTAGAGVDACGHQRVFKWDFNADGAFNDASGSSVTFDDSLVRLAPSVHTISVRASSNPSCPASPPQVRDTTLNITTTPPVIYSVSTFITPLTSSSLPGKALVGDSILVNAVKDVLSCLPFTQTVDCGPDNVGDSTVGKCQYNSAGVRVISVTVEQFGIVVSKSVNITVATLTIGGPYRADPCSVIKLKAGAIADACGVARSLAWDLNNDGVFDDLFGGAFIIHAYNKGLGLGVHTISVRATSSSCSNSPPEVASTTITVTTPRLVITNIETYPTSGLSVASVAERIQVTVRRSSATCVPDNLVIDCGADSVGSEAGYCRYSNPGIKTISATVAQFGAIASLSRNITVTAFYMGGPYTLAPCAVIQLAAPTTIDACGRPRVLSWDFNDDGVFDDGTGNRPYLYNELSRLAPGVHPIHVQVSSNPACPASPTEVHTVNVTATAGAKPDILLISTFPASGHPLASTQEDIRIYVDTDYVFCLPYTVTIDCGADNVSNRTSYCRYSTPGQKVITATITQSGVSVSRSINITITGYFIGGPYSVPLCHGAIVLIAAGGVDDCGHTRNLAWDFNNDGVFNDATGLSVLFNVAARQLLPGVYPISVRLSSNTASCPGSIPIILTTNVTVTGPITPPKLISVHGFPESGNARATVGEAIEVNTQYSVADCLPFNLTIDCGLDAVGNKTAFCQYGTSGVRVITATLSQEGVEVSLSLNVTVTAFAPSCATAAFPEGRVRGKRGCSANLWPVLLACNLPSNIKPYTKLYDAFASRATEDAQLIERLFGNRTISQALIFSTRRIDAFAREATAALLNAEMVYYAQCPLSVKLDFRHALYDAGNITKLL
eukprot:jgi/Chlat1/6698/Chrsp490S06119